MPILHSACTLDAVLGGEFARGVDDLDEAIRATPLARTDGICHGSFLILLDCRRRHASGSGRPEEPVGLPRNRSGPNRERVPTCGYRPWAKNLLNRYEARLCEGGAWLGTGRIDEVSELLPSVLGIGKRRLALCKFLPHLTVIPTHLTAIPA